MPGALGGGRLSLENVNTPYFYGIIKQLHSHCRIRKQLRVESERAGLNPTRLALTGRDNPHMTSPTMLQNEIFPQSYTLTRSQHPRPNEQPSQGRIDVYDEYS